MLVLGVPLMLACFAFGTKRFFRGETLNASTEVKVPAIASKPTTISQKYQYSHPTEKPAQCPSASRE